jgi:pimeloyl-ACP methyl ester carboxylesterase
VIHLLRSARPEQSRHVFLFGVSLGASISLLTACMRRDISGVICESPFASYRHALAVHARHNGLPSGCLLRLAVKMAEWRTGESFDIPSPKMLVERSACPVLVFAPADDPFLPPDDAAELRTQVQRRKDLDHVSEFVTVSGAEHGQCLHADVSNFVSRLRSFGDSITGDTLARRAPAAV